MESTSTKMGSRFSLYTLTFFAIIGGLLFGYNIAIVSGAMLLIAPQFHLSTLWQEIIVTGVVVAAAVAALATNIPLDRLGRRHTIMLSDVIFVVGAVVLGASVNKEMLLFGRVVVGIGTGMTSVVVPVYVAECSPAEIRGRLVSLNQLTITIGILLSSVVCGVINEVASNEMGWRYYSGTIMKMAGFPVRAAIWLVVLPNSVNFLATFIGLWAVERYGRRVLVIASISGIMIACVVLATGFHLSASFSPRINNSVLELDSNGAVVTLCHGQFTTCEECVTDHRCGFCFDDVTSGTCLPTADDMSSSTGRCNTSQVMSEMTWMQDFCPNNYTWISILGMALFVLAFAPGLGPMPWTINSEIFPLWARSKCTSITTATVWATNGVVAMTFLTLTEGITKYGTFWLFAGLCFTGAVVFYLLLPETKDKTLEEVEELFMTEAEKFEKRKSAYPCDIAYVDIPDAVFPEEITEKREGCSSED